MIHVVVLALASLACQTPESRQFDFWVGSWRVVDRSGTFAGTNNVTREFNGCVVQEHWKGAKGGRGSSFNTYLPGNRAWQQTWVDGSGLTLRLLGGMVGNSMVLRGTRKDDKGKSVIDKITWTPLHDGRVRQFWQESSDAGEHWVEVFDGYYSRSPQ